MLPEMKRVSSPSLLAAVTLALTSCSSVYYRTMETFGYEKRDILVERVDEGRAAQEDAKQQFEDALEAFQAVTGFQGGDLESVYDRLGGAYESSVADAETVRRKIRSIEEVAGDLFDEWDEENATIQDVGLKSESKRLLVDTQTRYVKLVASMRHAASRMDPVLAAFHDHVIFLKHNLNARAIASLEAGLPAIQADVTSLVADMEAAIAEAERFLEGMGSEE